MLWSILKDLLTTCSRNLTLRICHNLSKKFNSSLYKSCGIPYSVPSQEYVLGCPCLGILLRKKKKKEKNDYKIYVILYQLKNLLDSFFFQRTESIFFSLFTSCLERSSFKLLNFAMIFSKPTLIFIESFVSLEIFKWKEKQKYVLFQLTKFEKKNIFIGERITNILRLRSDVNRWGNGKWLYDFLWISKFLIFVGCLIKNGKENWYWITIIQICFIAGMRKIWRIHFTPWRYKFFLYVYLRFS